ncbi:UDP-N-acetylmuramoylalanine--D-glutamate ligase [Bacteroidia bacterium]|nr:UDP-N-acetylmuramoylalanine--D-glutamate ligase [Bacteroidia bacterium]
MNVVVLGAKESGTGAALLGKKVGYEVFLSDIGTIDDNYRAVLEKEQIPFEEGQHTLERILKADIVVKSPGIPDSTPVIKALQERNIEIISEIEFAGRHSTAKMICITGSNGKTTTTLLTHHLLTHGGIDAGLAGNVGYSLAAQVAENAHPVYVVELSSFQLDGMSRFKADIGVLTNITPDHLDRYDYKFENYVASKFRILQNMDAHCLFIHSQDNMTVAEKVWDMKKKLLPETASFTSSFALEDARLVDGIVDVVLGDRAFRIHKDLLPIKGQHNICNAMVAILIAMRMGLSDEAITEGLQTFPQVPHRMETVAIKDGVIYINDSKATNVDAAWYALDSLTTPVVWIAGGTDKGNDYSVLFDLVKAKVKVLICMGIDNTKLIESFSNLCPLADTHSLAEALAEVQKRAKAGDTVLLSPCCASFDLFKNYEDRGEQFRKSVI